MEVPFDVEKVITAEIENADGGGTLVQQ